MWNPVLTIATCVMVLMSPLGVRASEIYVDNVSGNDRYNGRAQEPVSDQVGPVRTLARALSLITGSDALILTNTGVPYEESMILSGGRLSGSPGVPLLIFGNGAVLDGSRYVPPGSWVKVGEDVWKMTPWRKGQYQLVLDDKPVDEHPCPPNANSLPEIPPLHWMAWKGSIYYRSVDGVSPAEFPFRFAVLDCGISLYAIHDVRISDLTLKRFRIDGINAHDQCRRVELVNVTSTENGRAGLSVGGSSFVTAKTCSFVGNRGESVRIDELGAADVRESVVDDPPPGEASEAIESN